MLDYRNYPDDCRQLVEELNDLAFELGIEDAVDAYQDLLDMAIDGWG